MLTLTVVKLVFQVVDGGGGGLRGEAGLAAVSDLPDPQVVPAHEMPRLLARSALHSHCAVLVFDNGTRDLLQVRTTLSCKHRKGREHQAGSSQVSILTSLDTSTQKLFQSWAPGSESVTVSIQGFMPLTTKFLKKHRGYQMGLLLESRIFRERNAR